MSLSSAMYNGVSGLNSFSTALQATSDNVANTGTTAYKSNTLRFGDLVSSYYNTQSKDTDRRGAGSMVLGVATDMAQGPMVGTSSWSDMAINGPGYFTLAKALDDNGAVDSKIFYTRDGGFYMDKNGYLVNYQGYHVLGSNNGRGVPIRVEANPTNPVYTNYSVDNTGQIWGYHVNPPPATPMVNVGNVNASGTAPAHSGHSYPPTGGTPLTGNYGTLGIDTDGNWTYTLDRTNPAVIGLANGQTMTDTFTVNTIPPTTTPATQPITENITVNIVGPDDVTTATWWDPQKIAYPVQVVIFPNEGGLIRQGGNLFLPGPESKDAVDVTGNPALRGDIAGFSLESSNVDLAKEMVNMIIYQSSYSANTKSITTSRDMIDSTINLVR